MPPHLDVGDDASRRVHQRHAAQKVPVLGLRSHSNCVTSCSVGTDGLGLGWRGHTNAAKCPDVHTSGHIACHWPPRMQRGCIHAYRPVVLALTLLPDDETVGHGSSPQQGARPVPHAQLWFPLPPPPPPFSFPPRPPPHPPLPPHLDLVLVVACLLHYGGQDELGLVLGQPAAPAPVQPTQGSEHRAGRGGHTAQSSNRT